MTICFPIRSFSILEDMIKTASIIIKKAWEKKGKMKDEMEGIAIAEFVGLRAKIYSIFTKKGKEIKKRKE